MPYLLMDQLFKMNLGVLARGRRHFELVVELSLMFNFPDSWLVFVRY